MRFQLIDAAKAKLPQSKGCATCIGVSQSRFTLPGTGVQPAGEASARDIVLLAQVRSAFALSKATYGQTSDDSRGLAGAGHDVGRDGEPIG